jgi:hypothetical protein
MSIHAEPAIEATLEARPNTSACHSPMWDPFGSRATCPMTRSCSFPTSSPPATWLLKLVEEKKIDPSVIITHRMGLTQAAQAYERFAERQDGCIKVVLDPTA